MRRSKVVPVQPEIATFWFLTKTIAAFMRFTGRFLYQMAHGKPDREPFSI
jgi:hypothetical protein